MIQSALKLVDCTGDPQKFFGKLPSDWKQEARDVWPQVAADSQIFILQEGSSFRGGGIVSRAIFPDMQAFEEDARHWYARNYYYIAFLFVPTEYQSHGYGSVWLKEIRKAVPARGFWLSIEKIGLLKFYARSGFQLERIVRQGEHTEWLLVSPREDW
jgi:GNAT superfamily N-acetyltransferase